MRDTSEMHGGLTRRGSWKAAQLLLLLLLPSLAYGQGIDAYLDFPELRTGRVRPGLFLASQEPFTGTLTIDNGFQKYQVGCGGSISPTYIRGLAFPKWVDACTAIGWVEGGGTLRIDLQKEKVMPRGALPMRSPAVVTYAGGTYKGYVDFPLSRVQRVSPGHFVAGDVKVGGRLELLPR